MPTIQSQINLLFMHRTVGIVLVYLNCHAYILFVVVFTLVGRLVLGSICLFSCSLRLLLLAIVIITAYLITSDGCPPR